MVGDSFSEITTQALKVCLFVASPMLLGALLMGIIISLFQAVTQINEQTLSFIPKIVVIMVALVIFAPWMSKKLTDFTQDLIVSIPKVVSQR